MTWADDNNVEWDAIMHALARDFVKAVDPKRSFLGRPKTCNVWVDYVHESDDVTRVEFVVKVTAISPDDVTIDWDRDLAGLWRVGVHSPADPPLSPAGVNARRKEERIRDEVAFSFRSAVGTAKFE